MIVDITFTARAGFFRGPAQQYLEFYTKQDGCFSEDCFRIIICPHVRTYVIEHGWMFHSWIKYGEEEAMRAHLLKTQKEPDFREDFPRETSGAVNSANLDPYIYRMAPIKEDFRDLLPKDQLEAHRVMEALKRKGILTDIGLPHRENIRKMNDHNI